MAYVVTGSLDGRRTERSRVQRSSAAVVASEMIEAGYSDVILIDKDGDRLSLTAFRHKHWSGPRALGRYFD